MASAHPDLVERDREVAALEQVFEETVEGQGRVALIEGPAGIGKSRLLAEVRRRADAEGVPLLSARGSELEREFAFGAVRQLFEPVLGGEEERERAFAGAAAGARTLFDAQPESGGDTSFAALHSLFWLCLNIAAERPLVLSVDDLHWIDRPSLRFLAYLVRRLEDLPILVATTLRTAEPGTDTALLGEIAGDPATVPVRPGPLGRPAVHELVSARLDAEADARFASACHSVTGGNPLFLRQLLSSLGSEGVRPEASEAETVRSIGARAVSRTVLVRLARLSEEAIAVARAVAVLGEGAQLRPVAALAELDERRVAEATGALARAEILRPETPLGFVHPLVREAVYHDLSPGERELRHSAAARMLSEVGAPAEQVAAQLLHVPPQGADWVAELLLAAGRSAALKGAPDSAAAYLRRALAEPPPGDQRAQVLFELGLAETHVSGLDAAVHLEQAYGALEDPAARGLAAFMLARTRLFTGEPDSGQAVAAEAAASLPAGLEDVGHALEAIQAMSVSFGAADPSPMLALERYREGVGGDGPGAKMLMSVTGYALAITGGPKERCLPLARRALEGNVLIPADNGLFWVTAIVLLAMADEPDALDAWEPAYAQAQRDGSPFGALSVHLWRGFTLLRRGELKEADGSLRQTMVDMAAWASTLPQLFAYPRALLGEALFERGRLEEARQVFDPSYAPALGAADSTRFWVAARAELLLREGHPEEALALLEEYAEPLAMVTNPAWISWRTQKARALERVGRGDEARALAAEELDSARGWGGPRVLAKALRTVAELDPGNRIEILREAAGLVEGTPARLETAECLAALGSALRRAREPSEAREPLRRALELAEVCDAGPLAEHARAELHAAGVRPRTAAMSGPRALTASEKRVAALAAEGQTNRDIAQTLYVTPKTVEVHLTGAYRKLGIRSRRELPRALEEAA